MTKRSQTADGADSSGRFEIRRRLGQGGMGIVYEAFDRERGITVALKTLREATPDALFRFKQEFRALADVRHPNLVKLYELLCIDDDWLLTMELIEGIHLQDHLRPEPELPPRPAGDTFETLDTREIGATAGSERRPGAVVVDFAETRELFRQLAMGLQALHQTSHVHRDIKPSNIMVTPEHRVVLLDFGVIGVQETDTETIARGRIVGTPTYMSPEQMRGGVRLTPANDWYAFGLVLYEMMTGRRPFRGGFETILADKLAGRFQPPAEVDRDTPAELDALCCDLLRADPAERPTAPEILERLGGTAPVVRGQALPTELVGRDAELALLEESFARARAGDGGVVYLVGGSGMGKSSTVAAFLDRVSRDGDVTVLAGRCHEHEAVPFKGVDRLVDELSRTLALLPDERARAALPDDVNALTKLFPVLRRLDAVDAAPRRFGGGADPFELRRRGFAAMRELLTRLAADSPTILVIDDFQWADLDSANLLADVMAAPEVPPLLLLICSRSEDRTLVELLQARLPGPAPWRSEIELGPLDAAAVRALARTAAVGPAAAEELAIESGGNPYFMRELLRVASARRAGDRLLSLDEILVERASALPDGVRVLVELVAIAGKPTPRSVISSAMTRVTDAPFGIALDRADSEQLLRSRGIGERDLLEPYHDRIRESLVAAMSDERRRSLHQALASAMQALGSPDVEALATHLEGAGRNDVAAEGYARAAKAAADSLAFDRAAALFRKSLSLAPGDRAEGAQRMAWLADALANAGRGSDAADAYREVVALLERVDPTHPLVLRCRARVADELMRSGRIDEGLTALGIAMSSVGLTMPRRDLPALLWARLRLRLRGMRYRPRPPEQIPVQDLMRVELVASAATALGNTVHLKGAVFQCQHLRLALHAGHTDHIARGFGYEAIFVALQRRPSRKRVDRLNARAAELVADSSDPLTIALVRGARGLSLYYFGDWESCIDDCRASTATMREHCTGVWFEANTIETYELWALYYAGRLAELSNKVSAMLRAASAHGDRYLVATLSTGLPNLIWLMNGDVEGARTAATQAMEGWSRHGNNLQLHWLWHAMINADLYAKDGVAAWQRVEAGWRAVRRSLLLNIPMVRVEALDLRARAALAAAAFGTDAGRAGYLSHARAATRGLQRIGNRVGDALASLHAAGIAELRGRADAAVTALHRARVQADEARMGLHGAIIAARLGELEEDPGGRHDAFNWMRAEGIVHPRRFITMMYPAAIGHADG